MAVTMRGITKQTFFKKVMAKCTVIIVSRGLEILRVMMLHGKLEAVGRCFTAFTFMVFLCQIATIEINP